MRADELLTVFTNLYPKFAAQWASADNLHRSGDTFTAAGVCAEFSSFYQDLALPLDTVAASSLFDHIESIVANDLEDVDAVANALCTCFVENIAHTGVGESSSRFMGPATRKFFDFGHSGFNERS